MDNIDLMGILLQNTAARKPATEEPKAATQPFDPLIKIMNPNQQTADPFSPDGLVSMTKSIKTRSGGKAADPEMSQADFLQKQLVAMQTQGLAQQQKGVEEYQAQLAELTKAQAVNPWVAALAGASDLFSGTKNLDKLTQQQQLQKQMALAGTEKIQRAKNDLTENQTALIKAQLDYEKAKEKNETDEARWKMMFGAQQAKNGDKLLPGQEAADKDFGKEYSDWNQKGGRAGYLKNKEALEAAIQELNSDPTLTGPSVGGTPEIVRPFIHKKSAEIEQRVKASALGAVKQLGANPTDTDLKEIYKSVWDSKLPVDANVTKVKAFLAEQDRKAAAKDEASKYFEQTGGTLRGQGAATKRTDGGGGLTPAQEKRRQELLKKAQGG